MKMFITGQQDKHILHLEIWWQQLLLKVLILVPLKGLKRESWRSLGLDTTKYQVSVISPFGYREILNLNN